MGDISNAYQNAFTHEKVYLIAGPEWKEKEGQIIIIRKAVYGLKTSGNRWHAKFSETLRGLEFFNPYNFATNRQRHETNVIPTGSRFPFVRFRSRSPQRVLSLPREKVAA